MNSLPSNEDVRKLAVFTILREGMEGVAPTYMKEKYKQVMEHHSPYLLLDNNNRDRYNEWLDRWGFQLT